MFSGHTFPEREGIVASSHRNLGQELKACQNKRSTHWVLGSHSGLVMENSDLGVTAPCPENSDSIFETEIGTLLASER